LHSKIYTMTIKQGLKKKNRLISQAEQAFNKTHFYNSYRIEDFDKRPYSSKQSLDEYIQLTNELIMLKTKIQRANSPVYERIFRLSELKNMVVKMKKLDCEEGTQRNGWEREEKKKAEISVKEKDELIASMEKEIEEIQDQLDEWNQVTTLPE